MKTSPLAALLLLLRGGLRACRASEREPSQGATYLRVFSILLRLNSHLCMTSQCYLGALNNCFKVYFRNIVFNGTILKKP